MRSEAALWNVNTRLREQQATGGASKRVAQAKHGTFVTSPRTFVPASPCCSRFGCLAPLWRHVFFVVVVVGVRRAVAMSQSRKNKKRPRRPSFEDDSDADSSDSEDLSMPASASRATNLLRGSEKRAAVEISSEDSGDDSGSGGSGSSSGIGVTRRVGSNMVR